MKLLASKKAILLVVALIIAVMVVIYSKRHHASTTQALSEQTTPAKPVLSVSTVTPTVENWHLSIRVNGVIAAWQEAIISAEIAGLRIAKVWVDVGDEVKQGQPLVTLNDETIVAALHKQQAAVARDKANLAEAKSNADRAREIKDSGALSTQQINQYLIAEDTAKANLAASQAELENQQIQLKHTRVIAADSGVITARNANLGNVVSAGSELFRLIRQGRIEWRAEVNAEQLTRIQKGQKVQLTLPDGKQIEGTVRMNAPTLDTNTRNALIYVDIAKGSAKPGMYAQGEIQTGAQTALVIPQSAIVLRDGRSYVFEVNQNYHVIQHAITTGRRLGDLVEISTQHTGNDQHNTDIGINTPLVATGGAFLNDGDIVNITNRQVHP